MHSLSIKLDQNFFNLVNETGLNVCLSIQNHPSTFSGPLGRISPPKSNYVLPLKLSFFHDYFFEMRTGACVPS
jgi:hypothetical protein